MYTLHLCILYEMYHLQCLSKTFQMVFNTQIHIFYIERIDKIAKYTYREILYVYIKEFVGIKLRIKYQNIHSLYLLLANINPLRHHLPVFHYSPNLEFC